MKKNWLYHGIILWGNLFKLSLSTPCPGMCNGHGLCIDETLKCHCFDGFQGGDCSEYICPFGSAWVDLAVGIDDAHNSAECSNMGLCDRTTGLCKCREGFEGKACERKICPYNCNGNGKCQSMKYYAEVKNPGEGEVFEYNKVWDADMMYGCNCDRGYHGPDCSLRYCPVGDDPLTGSTANTKKNPLQKNEVQKISCRAGSGYFTLSFRSVTTDRIPYNTNAIDLEIYLEKLVTVGEVKVIMPHSPGQACTDAGTTWTVEFLTDFGDLPMLVGDTRGLYYGNDVYTVELMIEEQTKGTKESFECSRRGLCNPDNGICTCEVGYSTSDGYNHPGDRGDCGYILTTIQQCPGIISCSGHGTCSQSPKFLCECSVGWTGVDCSERLCPTGISWFDRPLTQDDSAHIFDYQECSDMGICNRETGACQCMPGFTGVACERLLCPVYGQTAYTQLYQDIETNQVPQTNLDDICSGHGQCLSMTTLATLTKVNGEVQEYTYGRVPNNPLTWDYDSVYGCYCDEGWLGYDCSLRQCPYGDDPLTKHQANEIQSIQCRDLDMVGTIIITFRDETIKQSLTPTTTVSELKEALESLTTIDEVNVYVNSPTPTDSLCLSTTNDIFVEFIMPFGDLPPLRIETENIDWLEVNQYTPGTKENIECSGRGLCNRGTGECLCFEGYGSSNGKGGSGLRGDCGYVEPIIGGNFISDIKDPEGWI